MKKIMLFSLSLLFVSITAIEAQSILGEAQMIENSTDCDVLLNVGCVELPDCQAYILPGPPLLATTVTSTNVPPSGCPDGSYVVYYVTWANPACAGIQSGIFVNPSVPAWILCYGESSTSSLPGCPYNGCNEASYPIWWSNSLPNTIEVGP